MYRNLDSKNVIACDVGGVGPKYCGVFVDLPLDEGMWFDCSNDEFKCVANYADVLAVPREPLVQGLKYTTQGAELVVERCFGPQYGVEGCNVALVSSRCVGQCDCFEGPWANRGVFFYYAEGIGVTAFLVTPNIGEMRDSLPTSAWALVAKEGFLHKPLALPQPHHPNACGRS